MNTYEYMVMYTKRGFGYIFGEIYATTERIARELLNAKYYNLGVEIISVELKEGC